MPSKASPDLRPDDDLTDLGDLGRVDHRRADLARGLATRHPLDVGALEELYPRPDRTRLGDLPEVAQFAQVRRERGDVPFFIPHSGVAANTVRLHGQSFVNYTSYNYLGSNGHPQIREAVAAAVDEYGTSVSASRLVGGEIPLHRELELALADLLGVQDSLVLVGGHATNVTILGWLFGEEDLILHDALAHNSLIQGAILSRAQRRAFRHSDLEHLRGLLTRLRGRHRHVLLVVEGVYSMDGDICPLPGLLDLAEEFDCMIMVDEAHSIGVLGPGGRGVAAHFGIDPERIDLHMGTLSKAFNSCGGYLAGSAQFVDWLRFNLPGFVFSVGMSPANTAAALESVRLCVANPQWQDELRQVSRTFLDRLRALGADTGLAAGTPVVPLITGDSPAAERLSRQLLSRGVHVAPIMHPAVSDDAARLRFFLSRAHTPDDLDLTFDALAQVLDPVRTL